MARSLKAWIRQKEGHEVEVVGVQQIRDLDGNPTSLNVLVSARLDGALTTERLKEQLDAAAVNERSLREQLRKARQDEDVAAVNRLVAELTQSRTAFVTSNEVTSYKVSLSRERPPVLAFWPGLPFETVREEAARSLAASRLSGDIGLEGLLHYTSATALLRFTNGAGERVYIDPFRVTEVSLTTLQSLNASADPRPDAARRSRIESQWAEFLNPSETTTNR
jgi:hypothetical protein